jgi:hypothetical protein
MLFIQLIHPFGIKIQKFLTEISSWLTLHNQPSKALWSKTPTRSWLDTNPIYYQSDAKLIPSLNNSPQLNATESLQHMPTQSENIDLVMDLMKSSNLNQSDPSRIMWRWPHHPRLDRDKKLHSFYKDNLDTIPTKTKQNNNRQQ